MSIEPSPCVGAAGRAKSTKCVAEVSPAQARFRMICDHFGETGRIMRADEIDDRDRAILRALMNDGRLTNLALAERVHLSSSACLRRVRLLEESGLIAGYVMLLDPDVDGPSGAAFVFVTLEQQGRATLDRFEQDERRHPEIIECYLLTGASDYLLRVAFRNAR